MPTVPPPHRRLMVGLLAGELVLATVEAVAVVVPLQLYFPGVRQRPELLVGLALAMGLWTLWLVRATRRLSLPATSEPAQTRYQRALHLPGHALRLRLVMWAVVGLGGSALLVGSRQLTVPATFTVLTVCLVHALALALMRWALHKRLLRRFLDQSGLSPAWLQLQSDTLLDRLTEVSLVLGAVTAGSLLPFVYLFVPVAVEQFVRLETFFPWTGVVLGAVWYLGVLPRQVRPVLRYLDLAAAGEVVDDTTLSQACVTAHRLPVSLALAKMGFFGLGAALLLAESLLLFQFTWLQGALVFSAIVIATLGTSIYEMIWSRAVLAPVVGHIAAQPGAPRRRLRVLSLRSKMMLAFGGATVFTVLLASFWTTLQYGNLRRDYTSSQARRELEAALGQLTELHPAAMADQIARLHPLPGSQLLYVPQRGSAPGPLPSTAVATVQRRVQGVLELADHRLTGSYRRIDPSRPALGSLVVLVPATGSGMFTLNLGVLAFFFVAVLGISLGVVLLTSTHLTRPLVALERRAGAMAAGQLDLRVLQTGELDEIGRLTDAFEQMRRALQQKIATIEELNLNLEQKVRLRTAELERSNKELSQAFAALKQAQNQLVTSEKLASIGQLVAGIAHEINNPVNALVNTLDPLTETVELLLQDSQLSDQPALAEARADLQAMLRVIRSGASRTQRIVQALRNYSRQDAEERTTVNLAADIDETLALLGHRLRGIDLELDLQGPDEIQAYRGQLSQALMNLVANAADALQGQAQPKIRIATRQQQQSVVIEVTDNGPGISEEHLARIFDPFFTTKEVGQGTGLGLSISQRLVERHGGELTARSEPGKTTFRISIPIE